MTFLANDCWRIQTFQHEAFTFFFGNLNANSPHCIREPFNYVLTIREACFFPVN